MYKIKKLFSLIGFLPIIYRFLNKQNILEEGQYMLIFLSKVMLIKMEYNDVFTSKLQRYTERVVIFPFKLNIRKTEENDFVGQTVVFTKNGGNKIFDYSKNIVLHQVSYNMVKDLNEKYMYFQGILNSTYLRHNKECIIEKYIDYIPREQWSKKLTLINFNSVVKDILLLLEQKSFSKLDSPFLHYKNMSGSGNIKLKNLMNYLNENCRVLGNLPYAYLHCDIHFENILFDGEKLWYIDFEYAREEVFFFDIFNIMFVEYSDNSSSYLIDLYMNLNEEIIEQIRKCFEAVQVIFQEEFVKAYFIYFLRARLIFDIKNAKNRFKNRKLVNYYDNLFIRYKRLVDYIE